MHGNLSLGTMTETSKGHGHRKHLQVLLSPHRAKLFIDQARKLGLKPSALIRDLIYKFLEKNVDDESYKVAANLDAQDWERSVQNRLQGRAISKLLSTIRDNKKDA